MPLAAGDIAIVGIDTDAPDRVAFVALVNIAAGEVINFTDNGWLAAGSFRAGENTAVWTAPAGGITAGTVVVLNAATASTGTVTGGLTGLSAAGESVIAFQGAAAAPTLIYAINDAGAAVWQADAINASTSALPTGLVNGSTAIALPELDNYSYTGTTTGTKAALLAAIGSPANWVGNDVTLSTYPASFTVQTVALPTVNLSVSTNAGTEAGTTVVTVTATASTAVTGAQTVNLAVTGTSITAGDYALSNAVITIANGQTTGTVTFTVTDDALAEALETAVLTISTPSAGIALGSTLTQNISITDNDAPTAALTYSDSRLNEARAFDGTVSGKLVIALTGDTFAGTDGEVLAAAKVNVSNVPAGLTAVVTRVNATTAELSFTGAANNNANVNDTNTVSVIFTNIAFTGGSAAAVTNSANNNLGINFADTGTPGSVQTFTPNAGTTTGSSDASSAVALDANFMVVADDEASVLRVYDRAGGPAVLQWSYSADLVNGGELDLEASTRIGDTLYFIGSHSNTKSGAEANSREFIFTVNVSGSGANTVFTYGGKAGLETALATWDSTNMHTKGANYFGFTASSANGVAPELVSGFSMEGLTASQDGTQLFLAFRAPQTTTTARNLAVIVPVTVASVLTATPVFGTPIELNLGGRGIRSIEKSAGGSDYLILAGPSGSASAEVTNDFRLFRWDGISTTPVELNVSLDVLRDTTGGSFETIVDVQSTAGGTLLQLLQDNGDTVWPGQTQASKDLASALQQFQGNWISIGAAVPTDTAAPALVNSTPAVAAIGVGPNANLVLRFDEAVKAGTGNFVIRKASDISVVESIPVADAKVTIAFNTVTINPAATLDPSTTYYVEAVAGTLTDTAAVPNNWAGLTGAAAYSFTTSAPFVPPKLLITEVNSNVTVGGDFIELYNYGTTAIELTGFTINDIAATTVGAVALPTLTLAAGARLVIVDSTDAPGFRTAWNSLPNSVDVLAIDFPNMGSADGVTLFDTNGNLVAGFNYTTANVTASDTKVIAPAVRGDTLAGPAASHAGAFVGGTATGSAVWDGVSTTAPTYTFAKVGEFGGFAQTGVATNIGSPGAIPAGIGAGLATPFLRPFTVSLGDFTVFSVDTDTVNTWFRNTTGLGAEVNGFGDTAPANDWLISRSINLNQTDAEYLSFTTWTRFFDTAIVNPEVKIKYSLNYSGTGTPTTATWLDLNYVPSPENSQVITPSGLIDLSAISGNSVYFAFQYSATSGTNAASWRVDDVKIEGYVGAVLSVAATTTNLVEGAAGNVAHTFTVTRGGSTTAAGSVNWAVTGGATSPTDAADFGGTLPSGVLNFAANETSKTITISATGDTTPEVDENFTVTLSSASAGNTIVVATASGSIVSDDAPLTLISAIQGTGLTAALTGVRTVQGVLTAFRPDLQGFFVQEEASDSDGNAATSEGIFVFYGTAIPVGLNANSVGDIVQITGTVNEFNGMTRLTTVSGFQTTIDNAAQTLPAAIVIKLPVASYVDWEAIEGMLVTVSSTTAGENLVITDNFNYGRYGQVTLTSGAIQSTFSETNVPNAAAYAAYVTATRNDQLVLDDGNLAQNTNVIARGGNPLSATNTLRAGDFVTSVTGVIDQNTTGPAAANYQTTYRIQAVDPINFAGDARPTPASLPASITGAEIKVASVNVLNYFTTVGPATPPTTFSNANGTVQDARGANTAAEFIRQQDKLVANILGLNADVVGLMEMQNNGFADGSSGIDSLVDALNAVAGAGTYAYVSGPYKDGNGADAVTAGNDAIMVALLYKPGKVTLVGQAVTPDLSNAAYDAFSATYGSRAPVAQTFKAVGDGEVFTVVVNHFKSKGSATATQGLDQNDGAGNAYLARERAATQLLDWLGTNPTGSLDTDLLLIGDFNAYSKEQPITTLINGGFTKAPTNFSYSFDGLWGSLDHALSSAGLTPQVTGVVKWAINAEEPTVLDYNTEFKSAGQVTGFYAPDAYRSSDHNPILIGLNLDSPAVNLSVSSNAGSEATPGNVITVTATVATASTVAQTVTVGVTGTGITAGDYTLSSTTLTIAANQLTGSVNFNVVDDALSEGPETAGVTISAPSYGIKLGTTVSQNIVIADNDVVIVPAPPAPPAPPPPPANLDSDNDGIPNAVESQVPALLPNGLTGDGNGDGVQDVIQLNVTSSTVPGSTSYVTLVADSIKGLTDTLDTNQAILSQVKVDAAPSNLPNNLSLNAQLGFKADVGAAGTKETFSIFVDAASNSNGYWVKDGSGVWNNLATSIETVGSKIRIDFAITDGGAFDADGLANGSVDVSGGAGQMQLSIIGQPPVLVPGSFWF